MRTSAGNDVEVFVVRDGLIGLQAHAAVAGAFKDAAAEGGKRHVIESPIFARADFERLEAEGCRELGTRLSQLQRRC